MKRKVLLTLITLLMVLATNVPTYSGIPKTYYDFIIVGDEVSMKNYCRALNMYFKIPENIRECFEESGWKIVISDEQLEDTWFQDKDFSTVAGASYNKKEVRLENSLEGANGIIHEIGHFVYWQLSYKSFLDTWEVVWKKEVSNISYYAQTSPCEGFAEAFERTWTDKSFKEICPESYAFVLSACQKISSENE